jgi:AI-2 transport protein TqsA
MSILRKEQSWLMTISLIVIAAVAIGMTLIFAQKVLIPFVLAVFVAQIASPLLDFQVLKLKFPRIIAVIITLLIVVLILAVLCILLADGLLTILNTAKSYSNLFIDFLITVFNKLEEFTMRFTPGAEPDITAIQNGPNPDPNLITDPNLADILQGDIPRSEQHAMLQDMIVKGIQDKIPRLVSNTFGTIMGFLSSFTLVSIFVLFLLVGRNPHVIQKGIYAEVDHGVRRYLVIKTLVSIATGLLVWLVLSLFNLKLAGVFGILSFLLNFIPSIGSIIATLLPIPIAVAQFSNPWYIAFVVLCPGVIQMSIGNFVEPKLMGKGLNLHPVAILFSLSFWGLLWGIPGMFLAVPITAIIRIVLMQFETLRPIGLLLAGKLPEKFSEESAENGSSILDDFVENEDRPQQDNLANHSSQKPAEDKAVPISHHKSRKSRKKRRRH